MERWSSLEFHLVRRLQSPDQSAACHAGAGSGRGRLRLGVRRDQVLGRGQRAAGGLQCRPDRGANLDGVLGARAQEGEGQSHRQQQTSGGGHSVPKW